MSLFIQNFPVSVSFLKKASYFALILAAACVPRRFGAQFKDQVNQSKGLDVGDVSFLYPPASGYWFGPMQTFENSDEDVRKRLDTFDELGYWPRLFAKPVAPKVNLQFWKSSQPSPQNSTSFIDPTVFTDLVDLAKGNKAKGILGAGVNFNLQFLKDDRSLDMSESDRWRITSFRFAPCSTRNYHGQLWSQNGLENKSCSPELRLVAQPFVGFNGFESRMGETFPFQNNMMMPNFLDSRKELTVVRNGLFGRHAADYAFHLFYTLTEQQSVSLANDLMKLKTDFRDQCDTTGKGLGVHPCFYKDAALQKPQVSSQFSQNLFEILKNYGNKKQLRAVSFMGSRSNQGNWFLFEATVKQPVQTDAIQSPATELHRIVTLNPESLMQKGTASIFKQGKGVIFSRSGAVNITSENNKDVPWQMTEAGRRSQTFILGNEETIIPHPNTGQDNLLIFLLNQIRFKSIGKVTGDQELNQYRQPSEVGPAYQKTLAINKFLLPTKVAVSGVYETDLLQTAARIENPRINDQYKVDCVSCHMARSEARFVLDGEKRSGARTQNSSLKNDAQMFGQNIPAALSNSYFPPAGLSAFAASWTQGSVENDSFRRRGGETYMMNQFSIYKNHPLVSTRVANESAEAADFTNRVYLKAANPAPQNCNTQLLRVCLATYQAQDLQLQLLDNAAAGLRVSDFGSYRQKVLAPGWPRVWLPERESAELARCQKLPQVCGDEIQKFESTQAGFERFNKNLE